MSGIPQQHIEQVGSVAGVYDEAIRSLIARLLGLGHGFGFEFGLGMLSRRELSPNSKAYSVVNPMEVIQITQVIPKPAWHVEV